MNQPAQQIVASPEESQHFARVINPFESQRKSVALSGSNNAEIERAIQEVQGAIVLAKRFPRSKVDATDKILTECTRKGLAESAFYSFKRGGQEVSGPTIRLAEVLAANWGNFTYGWRENARREDKGVGVSDIVAFAWDYESNVRVVREFSVKHWRDTKQGGYQIKDERDIYELCANVAARRMRACILNIIPGDVIEAAEEQCEKTLISKEVITPENIKALVSAFEVIGVSKAQIEKRIGRKLEAESLKGSGAIMLSLRKIYNGIKEGMSKPDEFFEPEIPAQEAEPKATSTGEGQAGAEGGRTGGANPPAGAEPRDWDAFADEMITGLQSCADEKTLDALLEEYQESIGKLQASKDKAAMQRWAKAVQARRTQLNGGKLV